MNFLKLARQLVAILRSPPTAEVVYRDYNATRRNYILQVVGRHFGRNDDDPVPLYGKTLLDVGCGECTVSDFLALSGGEITAIDPNAEALKCAAARAEASGTPIRFIQGKVESLIGKNIRFDVILVLDLFEQVENPEQMFWVLRQLLNPGGIIIFSAINRTPKAWILHKILSEYIYRRNPIGTRHYRWFYRPAKLQDLAAKVGLKLKNLQGLSFSVTEQTWLLHAQPDTRYLATATLGEAETP